MREISVFPAILWGLVIFFEPAVTQEEIFRCFKKNTDKPINITLNCKASQVVNVIDAKYGHNRWSACLSAVAPGDCTETMFEAEKCNKQKICKLSVNHIYSFKCGEINYFRIMYSCNEVSPLRILQNYQRTQLITTTRKISRKNLEILPSILPSTFWKRPTDSYKIDNSEKVIFAICLTVTGIALTVCLTVIVIQCCSKKRKKHNPVEMFDEISIVLTEMQHRPSGDGAPPDMSEGKDIDQSTELNPEDDNDSSLDVHHPLKDCSQRWNLYHVVRQQIWRLKSRDAPEGHSPPICTVSQSID